MTESFGRNVPDSDWPVPPLPSVKLKAPDSTTGAMLSQGTHRRRPAYPPTLSNLTPRTRPLLIAKPSIALLASRGSARQLLGRRNLTRAGRLNKLKKRARASQAPCSWSFVLPAR